MLQTLCTGIFGGGQVADAHLFLAQGVEDAEPVRTGEGLAEFRVHPEERLEVSGLWHRMAVGSYLHSFIYTP